MLSENGTLSKEKLSAVGAPKSTETLQMHTTFLSVTNCSFNCCIRKTPCFLIGTV